MKKIIFRNLTLSLIIAFVPLAAISLGSEGLRPTIDAGLSQGPEQEEVNLTSDELRRLIYSSHVLTVIDAKPELEAALLALLELHSRNPEASPNNLVTPVRWALEEYRNEAMIRALPVTWRDEVLARYFLFLSKYPELPRRRQVLLNLLKVLLTDQDLPGLLRQQYVAVYSADLRFLALERGPGARQALMESCTQRAQSNASFETAMDLLLRKEVEVALDASPREILAANQALAQSPTMKELIHLSTLSEDGSVVITLDKLKDLFTAEMEVAREVVKTAGQALRRDFNQTQEILEKYPDNSAQVAEIIRKQEQELARQTKRIAASSSAARALSDLVIPKNAKLAKKYEGMSKYFGFLGSGLSQLGGFLKNPLGAIGGLYSFAAAGLQGASVIVGSEGESPDEVILKGIKLVGDMISDLSDQMDYRFDRVDRSLKYILHDLSSAVLLIGNVGRDVQEVGRKVDKVRIDLLEVQANLHRLESELHDEIKAGFDEQLVEHFNLDLAFEARTGESLPEEWYWIAENKFYSLAVDHARNKLRSNFPEQDALIDDKQLLDQLKKWPLESNLNYINKFLNKRLGIPLLSANSLSSLPDWYIAASAYLQLAVENPQLFRNMPGSLERLDKVIQAGAELEDFFRAITFLKNASGTRVNRELYDAVLSYYEEKLDAFKAAEVALAPDFNISMWRQWESRTPRIAVTETAVNGLYYLPRIPDDVVGIAAGKNHRLAIRANGTVVAWGMNQFDQCDVPAGLNDVVAVSAGSIHSLALKKDGTIVAWGSNDQKQCDFPEHKNIKKIAAGWTHNLALSADGKVIAWGDDRFGQCNVPQRALTGVIDIAVDENGKSLALKDNGTVLSWGGREPSIQVWPPLSDVVAISAGYGQFLGIMNDGTIVDWTTLFGRGGSRGRSRGGGRGNHFVRRDGKIVTDVTAIAFGYNFTLALKKNGKVEVINGNIEGTPQTGSFVAIAASETYALALRDDGTIISWGQGLGLWGDGTQRIVGMMTSGDFFLMEDSRATSHRFNIPSDLGTILAIYGNNDYCLALKPDGTVVEFPRLSNNTKELSNIVAIALWEPVISLLDHTLSSPCLTLSIDGTVRAWGDNRFGQCNVPANLDSVVAISAGWAQSLALCADGTVVTWGRSPDGQNVITKPEPLENVVAIAAGYYHNLALKADGTVVAWGNNNQEQCNVPKGLAGVVAIAVGGSRSLALKADGTVAAWGNNFLGNCNFAAAQTGVLAMACSYYERDSFLIALKTPNIDSTEPLHLMRGEPPPAVMHRLSALCNNVLSSESNPDLKDSLNQLTGAKALLESVIALGLPDSLEQDDLLRGFLFGSESIIDEDGVLELYEAEKYRLEKEWKIRASTLEETPSVRLESFRRHLNERLDALEKSGTPEIPRMVAHTLLQLRLLRAAY